MRSRASGLALAGLLVGAASAPAARADDVWLDFTESVFADWHWTLDDAQLDAAARNDVVDLRNRLNARLGWNQNTFGLRLDAALFTAPPSAQYASDVRPEEVFVRGDHPNGLAWLVGDDYVTLGRGMALTLRKLDEIGFTTGLRGAWFRYNGGGVAVTVGTGLTNVVNVDLVEEKLVPDPLDLVSYGRVEWDASDALTLAAHAVDIERRHSSARNAVAGLFGDDDDDRLSGRRYVRSLIGGGSVQGRVGRDWEVFGEFDYLSNDETRATLTGDEQAGRDGYAAYASAQGAIGQTQVLIEGKRYDHYDVRSSPHPDTFDAQGVTQTFPYVSAPTLERIDQRVVNNTNVTGVHLRVDQPLGPSKRRPSLGGLAEEEEEPAARHSLFGSVAWFADAPSEHDWTFHGYLGLERTTAKGQRLQVQAGYRQEQADAGLTRLRMIHLDLDWFETMVPGVDLQLHWSHEFRGKNIGAPTLEDRYLEGTFYLSVNLPPHWSITGQAEYLTAADNDRPLYPGAFLQYKLDSQSFVRLFVGRSKGGLKCSGGICRVFPDFDGLKLEATLRF